MTCYNCGLPPGATGNLGLAISIKVKPENGFQRESTKTVWVCSDECVVQAASISEYGPSTHRWPVTLSQFRSLWRRRHVYKRHGN